MNRSEDAAAKPVPPRPGAGAARARLAEILRVDHAGELAAVQIYRGQAAVFSGSARTGRARAAIERMGAQETEHLKAFEALLAERGVRPSALAPVWRAAGFALGAATALLGEKAAYACTEAVETVIAGHYGGQVEELKASEPELAERLEAYRADEVGHLDEAVAEGAREAPGHGLLSAVVAAGCRAAIKAAEKL